MVHMRDGRKKRLRLVGMEAVCCQSFMTFQTEHNMRSCSGASTAAIGAFAQVHMLVTLALCVLSARVAVVFLRQLSCSSLTCRVGAAS